MTLHELTGGRFVLGLGRVARPPRREAPRSSLRAAAHAHARLPGGVPSAPVPRPDAQPGPTGRRREPPVLIAALRQRMLELAATATDGALPFLVTVERVAWMRARPRRGRAAPALADPMLAVTLATVLDDDPVTRARGRARLDRAVLPVGQLPGAASPSRASSRPTGSRPTRTGCSTRSSPGVRRRRCVSAIAAMHAAGADHVAIIPVAPDGSTEHLPVLEALAPAHRRPG